MKKLAAALVAAVALIAPAAAQSHPLGNFTINRFARVEVSGHRLYVRYVLDMAEIPTFEARERGVDASAYARTLARGLRVTLAGRRVALVPVAHALAFPAGVGGLHTTRLEAIFRGPPVNRPESLGVRDTNYPDRIGWREIVAGANADSISDELRAYPKSLLQSPLDVTSARASVAPTHDPVPQLRRGPALEAPDRVADSGFTRLIATGRLSLFVIVASLVAALFWGAAHALSPGHGKTIVTAYLIGKRGTPRDAALLGMIVTVTHTIGVFSLGLVTLALSQWIVPDRLYPWIDVIAGMLVVSIGVSVLYARAKHAFQHGHRHHHHHGHEHGDAVTARSLLAIGISGGLLPCPSALVVLLAAISLHRLAFGLVLIVAFSVGLALSITGIGLVAVLAKRAFARRSFDGLVVRALPAVSALVILVAGVAMTAKAIPKVH
jgi:ABC-type nickel/cobalt efflux system permease component RcnA